MAEQQLLAQAKAEIPNPEEMAARGSSTSRVHLDDQTRRIELAILAGIEKSLQETYSEASDQVLETYNKSREVGSTLVGAINGNQADQEKVAQVARNASNSLEAKGRALKSIPEAASNIYKAFESPELYNALETHLTQKSKAIQAAYNKGDIEALGMIVGVGMTDLVGPGKFKKLSEAADVADEIADASKLENKIRHVEGELVNDISAGTNEVSVIGGKALSIADKPTTMLARAKEKAMEVVSKVPVLGDVVNPSLETRIALQAHKNRSGSDAILRAAQQGKTDELIQAQADMRASADDLIKKAKEYPDAAAQANKVLTNEQIQAGIVNNIDPSALKLTHGGTGNGVNLPDVPPPSYKDYLPMSARDAVHLALMPQNASPVRMARVTELMNAEYPIHATRVQMTGVPYAWATYGGGSIVAVKYALSGNDEKISNSELADTFTNAIHANNQDRQKIIGGIGGSDEQRSAFKNAVRIYEQAEKNVTLDKTLTTEEKKDNLQKIEKHFHDVISEGKLDQLNVRGKVTDTAHEQLAKASSSREPLLVEVPSNVQSTLEP